MLGGVGPQELLLVFFVILLLFGGKKLPELAKGLGKGIREFKKAQRDDVDEPEERKKLSNNDEE